MPHSVMVRYDDCYVPNFSRHLCMMLTMYIKNSGSAPMSSLLRVSIILQRAGKQRTCRG
jgi:hypothetical protein